MNRGTRWFVSGLVTLVLLYGGWWAWHQLMTKRVVAVHHVSQALRDNPSLAATRLLQRHGHPVRTERTLDQRLLTQLPAGMLVPGTGTVDPQQTGALLDWVRRGNTLVVRPAWIGSGDATPAPDGGAPERLDKRYGVVLAARARQDDKCRIDPRSRQVLPAVRAGASPRTADAPEQQSEPQEEPQEELQEEPEEQLQEEPADDADEAEESAEQQAMRTMRLVCVTPPGHGYPLELARTAHVLQPEDDARPLWGDNYGLGVLVFREGRGHVVFVADDYFTGDAVRRYDHGELLLVLARLAGPQAPVLIVQTAQAQTWPQALWQHFAPALCAAALLLLLWGWAVARRFGPAVPEPDGTRRALLEHVDASGRWLWQVPGGRELLLGAVRGAVLARLRRRAPELEALEPAERLRQLADRTRLPRADLERALYGAPARRAADFAHQISTLQKLRVHHER